LRDDGNKEEVLLVLTEKGQRANEGHDVVWQNVCSICMADLAKEQIKPLNLVAERAIVNADYKIGKQIIELVKICFIPARKPAGLYRHKKT